ncbi:MAG: DAK2 domain-containing protein [Lachnospiraceae bacterium]|nr:DAK2 domain-containing protein [Lachnospiraceae bacterium]
MFLAGARNLETKKEWINELNVFPVPDGDTGTNMTLTIMSAVKEVQALDPLTMESLSRAISSGSLRGARGNSGVILSQLLRGFTKVIRTEELITPVVLTAAFQKAVETAYKAVMKPKEGTILTVARGGAERAAELLEENPDITLYELMKQVLERSEEVLEKTPDLLPVLKEAGVVDSGGQGLVQVLKGAFDAFNGIEIPSASQDVSVQKESGTAKAGTSDSKSAKDGILDSEDTGTGVSDSPDSGTAKTGSSATKSAADTEIRFGYCTEFIILLETEYTSATEQDLKTFLESIGDSLVLVSDDGLVKVHVHTNDPGLALQRALKLGSLTKIKIDNMRIEHQERSTASQNSQEQILAKETVKETPAVNDAADSSEEKSVSTDDCREWKEAGFISVSIGEGIADIFRSLGVDCLIEGGQTMNPSTEDMLNAISQVPAKNIFILPNNKNIILAANQAQSLTKDKHIFVIPTKTVPQGITALINYVPEKAPEENARIMEQEIENVRTGQLTYAVRDTHIEDKVICAGDIMGVGDHSILAVGKEIEPVAEETVQAMMTDEAELISIYYGEDMHREEAEEFCSRLAELYPDCDVELNYGGQPIYYYIISVE